MNRLAAALFFVSALTLTACGESAVGRACTTVDDCDNGQTCFTDVPGGYCSSTCQQEGTDEECPGGSVCASHSSRLLCSKLCETKEDCRADYECNGVSGSSLKACRPKA